MNSIRTVYTELEIKRALCRATSIEEPGGEVGTARTPKGVALAALA